MEKGHKMPMRNNRRCIIYGCSSSSVTNPDLKFFRFPLPESPDYQIWLSACKDSYNQIRILKKPLVCSLHFETRDVGGRRLNPRAYPKLRLVPSEEYVTIQGEKQKMQFLNKVMEEWLLRNRPYRDIYGRVLLSKAKEAADLLDIPSFNPNKLWLQDFNEEIAAPGSKLLGKVAPCGLSLQMADVIRDLRQLEQDQKAVQDHLAAENSIEISDDDDYDDGDFSDSYADLSSKLEVSVTVDEESSDYYEPGAKMPKLQSILLDLDEEEASEKKKSIATYREALKYLKPLEDFALQKEDFRAIGLLTQLEAIFKQQE
ncbi:uncharacterized protein LOC129909172 [Episyrphus balteatus]|uniref:uncharacterized protein LOC129909172 n=1 Tax=Episyrphus balteatus TaxID=286459 RepID=UPI0024867C0B|nr:uncharacterized protein LOC129909172 [Episyrphus balteatus]